MFFILKQIFKYSHLNLFKSNRQSLAKGIFTPSIAIDSISAQIYIPYLYPENIKYYLHGTIHLVNISLRTLFRKSKKQYSYITNFSCFFPKQLSFCTKQIITHNKNVFQQRPFPVFFQRQSISTIRCYPRKLLLFLCVSRLRKVQSIMIPIKTIFIFLPDTSSR